MTGFGTNRRETTKMVDTQHPEYSHESSIDQTSIPYQMGSNRYASQKGMTGFGQPRWEVLDPSISYQNRKSQGKFGHSPPMAPIPLLIYRHGSSSIRHKQIRLASGHDRFWYAQEHHI